jgi:hypothetical protein
MTDLIHVKPTAENRRDFARWATAQTPKVDTVGLFVFGVPAQLFVDAPEELLIGALVDGHRYVSPDEDAAEGRPAPGEGDELLGVADPAALTPPAIETSQAGAPLENAGAAGGGDSSDRSDSPGDFAPLEDAPADSGDEDDGTRTMYGCPLCPRDFETERGRDTHRRQAHRED